MSARRMCGTLRLAAPLTRLLVLIIIFDVQMKIDDVSALTADEQGDEDEISDPEEDTIAGQMAAMRGGGVKKITAEDEESDEESSTDDDKSSGSDSDSDSD